MAAFKVGRSHAHLRGPIFDRRQKDEEPGGPARMALSVNSGFTRQCACGVQRQRISALTHVITKCKMSVAVVDVLGFVIKRDRMF